MKRLTKQFMYGLGHKDCYDACSVCDVAGCCDSLEEMLEKLTHFEDLEEQGRLIERKHGRWIHKDNFIGKYLMCSECSHVTGRKSNYCPNCGAKMDGKKVE